MDSWFTAKNLEDVNLFLDWEVYGLCSHFPGAFSAVFTYNFVERKKYI